MSYCSKCGKEVLEGSSFCQHCGTSLSAAPNSMQPSSMSSGLTNEDFALFVGKNSEKYLTKFNKFNVGGIDRFNATWHWPAFFVPFWWLIYRKIYGWAILTLFLSLIPYVAFLTGFVWAIIANYTYYKHAKKKLLEIKQLHTARETQKAVIAVSGGVGNAVIIGVPIVVAVIGILAAIAIPNFIAYRNKAFCSQAESDANRIAGAMADYFAVPSHTSLPDLSDLGITLSGNPPNTAELEGDPEGEIKISVTDSSCRCPQEYQNAYADGTSKWNNGTFIKTLEQ